ncbi:hypothetical protein SAY87_008075 [Trapa incisa]|uniref:Mic1 domain-containing protein n=1 Tax=Trapa incisa TaxID=236973 RepID=A0AAN7KKL6_9MYRT|nr:hypothetical protein SAY87_008075 [Trapa incisa]
MSAIASSSQPVVGLSSSGALSHAYIKYPPLRYNIPGSRGLFYDDGNKIIVSPTNNQVFSWKISPFTPAIAPTSDSLSEGPILSIKFSLDSKLIAIQRSNHEIQFQHLETGETFTQKCKSESESLLGFFWTDCLLCDIVFVKTSGLDLFAYNSESNMLHLVETRKLNVNWYVYTHESRLVLLASGMQCKAFTGFQLSSVGIIQLPKFEMVMAKSEANSKPILASEDVYIITVYGRIYCLQVDRVAMLLHSYRFYCDAVVQQGSLPIYSSKIAVSVVDNVLLVHQVDAKVVILYDIFLDSQSPISAPLPLLLRGLPRSTSMGSRSNDKNGENSEVNYLSDLEAIIYGDDWNFLIPDLICDVSNKILWKLHLDLEAIAASSSDMASVLDFLQRRKLEAYQAKHLCLATARTVILERRPLSLVARVIDVLVSSYANSLKTGNYFKGSRSEKRAISTAPHENIPAAGDMASASRATIIGKSFEYEGTGLEGEYFQASASSGSDLEENGTMGYLRTDTNIDTGTSVSGMQERQLTSPVISPDEMYSFVFCPVEEEMAGEPSYLVSIMIELLLSANSEKIKVHPNIYVLTVQLLARNEQFVELGLLIINKVLEPSREVALQLLESGRQNRQIRKLGLDMLRQLNLHHDYIVSLVQEGYYLEALRYTRKHKVVTVQPSLFLEAALSSKDPQHLAAVLRFFSDFLPGFSHTSDHKAYYHLLTEMTLAPVS